MSVDERIKKQTHAHREGMWSRTPQARPTLVRGDAPLLGRAPLRHYGSVPMKNLKSRIVTFLLASLVSLAAWGGVVYIAMHFVKK
jgi:hypothetical protein